MASMGEAMLKPEPLDTLPPRRTQALLLDSRGVLAKLSTPPAAPLHFQHRKSDTEKS